jgi:hypothetical protein
MQRSPGMFTTQFTTPEVVRPLLQPPPVRSAAAAGAKRKLCFAEPVAREMSCADMNLYATLVLAPTPPTPPPTPKQQPKPAEVAEPAHPLSKLFPLPPPVPPLSLSALMQMPRMPAFNPAFNPNALSFQPNAFQGFSGFQPASSLGNSFAPPDMDMRVLGDALQPASSGASAAASAAARQRVRWSKSIQ